MYAAWEQPCAGRSMEFGYSWDDAKLMLLL